MSGAQRSGPPAAGSRSGTQAQLDAYKATLAPGTEYVWILTDGNGTFLDIVSGVA